MFPSPCLDGGESKDVEILVGGTELICASLCIRQGSISMEEQNGSLAAVLFS